MLEDIKGKVILVTGGATGMGRGAALELGRLGAFVIVSTGHNIEGGHETVQMIKEGGGQAHFIQCDVTKEQEVEELIKTIVDKFGRLDCAFNNAGIGPDGVRIPFSELTEVTEEIWDSVIDSNLKSVFFCLKYELRQMQKQGMGSIVNNGSIGGLKMAPGYGAYGPSKSGVIAITRTAAIENAKRGIRVNVVCPGPTMGTQLMNNSMSANPDEEQFLKTHIIPMEKLGTVEDVAHAVIWLCSDVSKHTTGQVISVDGGMSIT